MGLEALKKQLADGEITLEQFKAEAKKLLDAGEISQEVFDEAVNTTTQGEGKGDNDKGGQQGPTLEEIQKLIQSATDKVRTEYSTKLKTAENELDNLKKEKMSDEEKADFERKKYEKEIKDREAAILEKEVRLHTVDKLRELEIPLEFRDIVAGSDIESTDERIKTFSDQWTKALKAAVDARFKDHGENPNKGGTSKPGEENPWEKGKENLTKQAIMMRDDPAKAERMKAQAQK